MILISVFLSYFFKLENFLITIIFFLTIYDLKKSLFLNKFTLLISFFIFLSMLIFYNILSPYYLSLLNIILFVVSFISVIIFKKYLKIYFILSLISFFLFFIMIANNYSYIFYMIFFISFFNDTAAYIFGKILKGPLIISKISPKKTWSGTLISLILSTFIIIIILESNIFFALLCAMSLFFGDIFFSFVKRKLLIKDFSKIFSNHGGVLDRLDSMFFITPLFHIYYLL